MKTSTVVALLVTSQLFIAKNIEAQNQKYTLTDIENFNPGLKMQYLQTKDSLFAGRSGEGITWDFSTLNLSGDTINQEILKAQTVAAHKNYPRANIIEKTSDGKVMFVEKTATENKLWGIEQTDINMQYSSPYIFIRIPFMFKDSIGSTPQRSYEAYGGFKGQGITSTVADGLGTLILPTGKFYDVMRIKFEQEFVEESVSSDKMKTHIITYAWFSKTRPGTLLRISTASITSQYYSSVFHSVDVLLSENGLIVSGSPNSEN